MGWPLLHQDNTTCYVVCSLGNHAPALQLKADQLHAVNSHGSAWLEEEHACISHWAHGARIGHSCSYFMYVTRTHGRRKDVGQGAMAPPLLQAISMLQ